MLRVLSIQLHFTGVKTIYDDKKILIGNQILTNFKKTKSKKVKIVAL